jgi:uncharacterized membrane protein
MTILVNAMLIALVDILWLTIISSTYQSAIRSIQGGAAVHMRPIFAIPVYLALGYLLDLAPNRQTAFLIGMTVYAVYDFTVMTLFEKYPLYLALGDVLWGGVLFFLAKTILTIFNQSTY